MQSVLCDIINRLQDNQYLNEHAIRQGIILRVLTALGWDIYNPQVVKPEVNINGGFVDFALCYPVEKQQIFIEVKQSTTFNAGEDQLMLKYAFQYGVPIAILTDGQRWSFYLPGGSGSFEERRFYHLDLLERAPEETEARLIRYLSFEEVKSNRAFEAARFDHDDAARRRSINKALPSAWAALVHEADARLITALLEKVETMTGYRPDEEEGEKFLQQQMSSEPKIFSKPVRTPKERITIPPPPIKTPEKVAADEIAPQTTN